jgi:hypothetical protein
MSTRPNLKNEASLADVLRTLDSETIVVSGKAFTVLQAVQREMVPSGDVLLELKLSCPSE